MFPGLLKIRCGCGGRLLWSAEAALAFFVLILIAHCHFPGCECLLYVQAQGLYEDHSFHCFHVRKISLTRAQIDLAFYFIMIKNNPVET